MGAATKVVATSEAGEQVVDAAVEPLVLLECPRYGSSRKLKAYAEACREDSLQRGECPLVPAIHGSDLSAWASQAEKIVLYVDMGTDDSMRHTISDQMKFDGGTSLEYRTLKVIPEECRK